MLDWDERNNFVEKLMERNLDPEQQLEQINPEKAVMYRKDLRMEDLYKETVTIQV